MKKLSIDGLLLSRLVERIESKYFGKYRGYVSTNEDPEKRGRIKATVPSLFGNEETTWCEYCSPYGGSENTGFYMIPDKGSGVWIEFENGDHLLPIWTGTWWAPGKVPKEISDPTEPTTNIIKTKKGHLIMLEDKDGQEKITIQDKTKQNLITIDSVENSINIKANIIEIEATSSLTIKSNGTVTVQGNLVKIN